MEEEIDKIIQEEIVYLNELYDWTDKVYITTVKGMLTNIRARILQKLKTQKE